MTESIDLYCHWLTPEFFRRVQAASSGRMHMLTRAGAMPVMMDLDARFRVMDLFPGYRQVPSIASPPVEAVGNPALAVELARIANDEQAAIVARHPERFPGFVAVLPMSDPEAAQREASRAILELGALGVQIFSNIAGQPLDRPEFLDVIRHVARLGRPIWLHPTRGIDHADYHDESHSKFDIWWAFGWPYETSAAMTRLVFAGLMEESVVPNIITHHGGGLVPMVEGRLNAGLSQLGTRCPPGLQHTVETCITRPPIESFKSFFADTATFGSRSTIQCALDFFGGDRLVFASDMPFDPERGPGHIRSTLSALAEMDLDSGERQQILSGNARRLCGLAKFPTPVVKPEAPQPAPVTRA
ncbi:MAG TPA: amidohydrolase family protein [Opitutaceae bacterium]|nr:amidohydrolase family protein [Opitutaceae bacterium]